jgi:hypothetical protein
MARRAQIEEVLFGGSERALVLERMEALAAAADGARWMNLGPAVTEDDVPTGSALFGVFSARGPVIPIATWIPGYSTARGSQHTSVGILHPTGRDAAARLRQRAAPVPSRWIVEQDHPKRGLIIAVPPDVDVATTLDALLAMTTALTPFPFGDRWAASFRTPG